MTDNLQPSIAFDEFFPHLCAGEDTAWKILHQRVLARARRFDPHKEAGQEEIAQNVLTKTWQRLQDFDPSSGGGSPTQNFWAWIYTIVFHECCDYARRERTQLASDDIEQALGLCADHTRLTETKMYMRRTETLEQLADLSWLRDRIERLPDPMQRRVAFEHFIEGYTTNEVVERTQLSPSTVNNWIHRTPKKLRHLASDPSVNSTSPGR